MATKESNETREQNMETLRNLESQLKSLSASSGVDELKREVDFYKLALSRGSMAKKACGLIEIRRELGDSPEIVKIEESMVELDQGNRSKKSKIIRRTMYTILALANLMFLGKYTEFKDPSAIGFYSLVTFWTSLFALGNSVSDYLIGDRDDRRAKEKYEENMQTLIKIMDHYGVSPDGFTLTKKFKEKK